MKKNIFAIIVLILIGLNLIGCKNKTKQRVVQFDKLEYKEKIYLLNENDTTLPFADVKVEFTYPTKYDDKERLASLQRIFIGTFFNDVSYDLMSPKEALQTYIDNYTKSYRELSEQYYEDKANLDGDDMPPSWYWYDLVKSNDILFQDENITSYVVEHYEYTGGAHGSLSKLFYTIDLDKIITITEEDVFKPNYQKELTSKLIDALVLQYEVNAPEELIEKGFFDINEIAPNNNFWLDDKGINYIFNQYEIAPYSMGPIEVNIPYKELESLLLSNSLTSIYLK